MRRWLTYVVSVLLVSMLPMSALAISNGTVDETNKYPFVGLLAFYDSDGNYMHRCSGTLISDDVVVTAGHCTDGTTSAYAYFLITVPDDFRENPTGVEGHTYTHPDYNPRTIANDVGVVVLGESSGVSGPYPTLPDAGLLSELKSAHELKGARLVAAGYGLVPGFPPPVLTSDLNRRYASSLYRGLTRNNLHVLQNPNVDDAGGTCFGDSGGPHFLNDELLLVSVTSWGDAICRANDMTQRLDLPHILDFIEGFPET